MNGLSRGVGYATGNSKNSQQEGTNPRTHYCVSGIIMCLDRIEEVVAGVLVYDLLGNP